MLVALLPVQVPVELGRDAARQLARDELAKAIYRDARPGLTERLLRWLWDQLSAALDSAAGVSPGGYLGLAGVLLVLGVAVVAWWLRLGPLRRADVRAQPLFVGRARTAAEHRAAADAHAAQGRWADAVRDRLRAVITSLEERALLDPRPGRTADEAAAAAGAALPGCAPGLREAAQVFDELWYGGRPASRAHDETLRRLDAQVQAARPARATVQR
ncbi:MAG: hypothetical protein QOI54_1392 [Actinomycetota bacterium]|nr:hypothetical protein [Actinomycetota bacterium]